VVLTNGCFDLLHAAHAAYLEEAATLGDVLLVAVNGDRGVRRLKGLNRPIVGQVQRAALVAALACVDHVLLFDDDTPHDLLRRLRPDVLVKGGDYRAEEVIGREVVQGYGGRVCVTGRQAGWSTSRLIEAVLRSQVGAED
jgi:rfaE bifunctional protein nucleotidyltransferase chain/domain